MKEEIEIKLKILEDFDLNQIKNILEPLFNIKFEQSETIKDLYYDFNDNLYFNLNHALGIRDNKEIAYKARYFIPQRKSNPWFILENEYILPIERCKLKELFDIANIKVELSEEMVDIQKLKEIFDKVGIKEKMKINKIRSIAKGKDFEIFLDFIENLGIFIEIEAKNSEILKKILEKIPFKYKQNPEGYTNIYAKEILGLDIPDFEKKFADNADWNYLNGQKEIINRIIHFPNL